MNINKIVPHYVVRQGLGDCECALDDDCDCMPELVLYLDGRSGYGVAHWCETDDTCPQSIDSWGKAYWCQFLHMEGFWAMGEDDAAETIRNRLQSSGIAAKVNYVNNKHAEALMEKSK